MLGKALEFFTAQGSHAVSSHRSLVEAWTSAIEIDMLASGALVNKRMDLLVGSFSRGKPLPLPKKGQCRMELNEACKVDE